MTPPFSKTEFSARTRQVKARLSGLGVDAMLIADPANIYWLTGIQDWSFYTPQFCVVLVDEDEPLWIGRAMDAPGARLSGWMASDRVFEYPDSLVQQPDVHPSDHIGGVIAARGYSNKRIGYESDSYYFSPRSLAHLRRAMPDAHFADCDLVVNWARAIKSPAEIAYMRDAAAIVAGAMDTAFNRIEPGVRQCDVAGAILQAQTAPALPFGGDLTAVCPMILAGRNGATAHPMWTDEPFESDQTIALELAGARRRYTCGMSRTLHLGTPPKRLRDTTMAVEEGLAAVLATIREGVTGARLHAAWRVILERHNLHKESRIGYSIGIGFPPDWGEHTISLRAGDEHPILANTTLHIMLGMWMEGWGMELSETVRVCADGVECLTQFPRALRVKD